MSGTEDIYDDFTSRMDAIQSRMNVQDSSLKHILQAFSRAVDRTGSAPLTKTAAMTLQNSYDDCRLTAIAKRASLLAAEDLCVDTATKLKAAAKTDAKAGEIHAQIGQMQAVLQREDECIRLEQAALDDAFRPVARQVAAMLPPRKESKSTVKIQSEKLRQVLGF